MISIIQKVLIMMLSALMLISSTFPGAKQPAQDHGEWLLTDVPSFDAGTYSDKLFNTGTGLDQEMETSTQPEPNPTYSYMQIIRDTTVADVLRYCAKLQNLGYRMTFCNQIENNSYFAYEKDDLRIYCYYNGYSGETRVIDDCCNTVSLDEFSYISQIDPDNALKPTLYQFSYPYKDSEHPDEELYADNGMLYVIRLSDKKLIIIDGGNPKQASEKNIEEFWKFLHKITGKKENAKLEIAMWYGTHAHGDHNSFFYKFIRLHRKNVKIERYMFNFQADEVIAANSYVKILRKQIQAHYPDALYVKARCGYKFRLQDAECEVLYTHEDFVSAVDASWTADNANDASCVLKVTLGGKTFLFLGDSYHIVEDILLNKYTADTLHADFLQAAHHLYNNLRNLYPVIAPTYVLCPQSELRAKTQPLPAYQTLRTLVPENNFFFADKNIVYGFTPKEDGGITITETSVDCGMYDGSPLRW